MQIADVYDEEMDNKPLARDYLELARDVVINDYRAKFGKAYMVLVTEEFIPYDHYYLFESLATIYNEMDQPEESIGATNWMKQVWPDSAASYAIAGKSHELLANQTQACREYREAVNLGYANPLPIFCN